MNEAPVLMDFLTANQLVAAAEQRLTVLRAHVQHGVEDEALDLAILYTYRGEQALRKAFRLATDAERDAAHEALSVDLADLAVRDGIPEAFASYQADGR